MCKLPAFFALPLFLLVGISGCGSGGGSGSNSAPAAQVASTTSFPLQAGFKMLNANGFSKSFTVTGSCAGSGTHSASPANTAASFEGVAGLSATSTITMSLTNCTPGSIAQLYTVYFDSNYVPLGFNSVDINFGVWLTPPFMPTSVTVDGTGIIGTENLYTDSTKVTSNGTEVHSYLIEADTSTTAIVNLIIKIHDASGTLTATEQNRFRIDVIGTLTPISTDIQYVDGTHLILTYD